MIGLSNLKEFMEEWNVYYLVTVIVFLTIHLFTDSSRHKNIEQEVNKLKIEIKYLKEKK